MSSNCSIQANFNHYSLLAVPRPPSRPRGPQELWGPSRVVWKMAPQAPRHPRPPGLGSRGAPRGPLSPQRPRGGGVRKKDPGPPEGPRKVPRCLGVRGLFALCPRRAPRGSHIQGQQDMGARWGPPLPRASAGISRAPGVLPRTCGPVPPPVPVAPPGGPRGGGGGQDPPVGSCPLSKSVTMATPLNSRHEREN